MAETNSTIIDPNILVEEECLPQYDARLYYPVRLGEVLNDIYKVIRKLGYGRNGTVWLAKYIGELGLGTYPFVAIKVLTVDASRNHDELRMAQLITDANPFSPDRAYVRTLYGSFVLKGPHGDHDCLAYWPQREPVNVFQRRLREDTPGVEFFTLPVFMAFYRLVLQGLRYLHRDCHIIHTDLNLSNILFILENPKVFLLEYEEYASENSAVKKILPDREIYVSDSDFGPVLHRSMPAPVISDFGKAVRGDQGLCDLFIQRDPYRAPEVSFGIASSYSADIWNLGALVFDCLAVESPIMGLDSKGKFNIIVQIAQIIRLLGPPPAELINRINPMCRKIYFDSNGEFLYANYYPPGNEGTFEAVFSTIPDSQYKQMFIGFLKRMLRWLPEERASIDELLDDPWMSVANSPRVSEGSSDIDMF
ncbi:kinase-like protein [Guyanagaster necrorhizus]|uniref:non-specific serine/threonine protein kinase n=1 Tax=Guyanagaster necrorhizus TaxID=856835 RepID=A0A9P8AL72_9AGAR|nr:kinase-like protein [Guyanagaster necrorhizus MCA 3950]KAG7439326.1 kinase-like protein [Guyanagaster necrorhizus MCA 3950]